MAGLAGILVRFAVEGDSRKLKVSKQATDNSVSKIDGSFTHATTCPAVLITLGIIETSKISDGY